MRIEQLFFFEFLGLWQKINNPESKGVEFDSFLFEAGSNSFALSPSKWIEQTKSIGLFSKIGREGGMRVRNLDHSFALGIDIHIAQNGASGNSGVG